MEVPEICQARIEFDSYVPCKKAQENPCYPVEFTAAMHQLVKALWYIDSVEEKLTEILKRIAHFYQADRAHIIEVDWDLYIGNVIYEYCALGVEPKKDELQEIDLSKLLRWHQATKQQNGVLQ